MNPHAQTALNVAKGVGKYTLLVFAWFVQYTMYVPFVAFPLWLLRVGGKLALIILALSVVGLPIVIVWLLLRGRPEPKQRRNPLRPWGI